MSSSSSSSSTLRASVLALTLNASKSCSHLGSSASSEGPWRSEVSFINHAYTLVLQIQYPDGEFKCVGGDPASAGYLPAPAASVVPGRV